LRIAITADPEIPVPPKHYGGIERIIDLLVRGLAQQGHEVTLFAHRDSQVPCDVVAYEKTSLDSPAAVGRCMLAVRQQVRERRIEVIHSFGRLAYLAGLISTRVPKLMSYQRAISRQSVVWGKRLFSKSLHFTACSRQMTERVRDICGFDVVYNSVSPEQYRFRPTIPESAPLVFLGRVERIKGAHIAIEVARKTGRRLVIAGNVPESAIHQQYFRNEILPNVDGSQIEYAGPVDDNQKDALLGGAATLLMPILWDEPFGIVMAEALACGTPVIGFNRGSVPEIVDGGVNGFVCDTVEDMCREVSRLDRIDRAACRRIMEQRFSSPVMVDRYLEIYRSLIGQNN